MAPTFAFAHCPRGGARPPWGGPAEGVLMAPTFAFAHCPRGGARPPWGGPAEGVLMGGCD